MSVKRCFQTKPEYWLNLDAQYRLRLQEDAKNGETAAKALIYRYMPVRELRKRGYLTRWTNNELTLDLGIFQDFQDELLQKIKTGDRYQNTGLTFL